MAFGRSDTESEGRSSGNRPDCAYFLLLGLCGAAFLLTIGSILTYIAFNPGSVDSRPHSPLSHIPHFHHHRKHHDRTEQGHFLEHMDPHHFPHEQLKQYQQALHHHQQQQQHSQTHSNPHNITTGKTASSPGVLAKPASNTIGSNNETRRVNGNETGMGILSGDNGTTPGNNLGTVNPIEGKRHENLSSITSSPMPNETTIATGTVSGGNKSLQHQQEHNSGLNHGNYNKNSNGTHHHHPLLGSSSSEVSHKSPQQHMTNQPMHPHPGMMSVVTHHDGNSSGDEYQAKQSLALAIIGPLCLLMGIVVILIVGVFALKYDCDHEPEPNIAFLRLRSEMSLNFDPSKNNYELLMPASSSTAGVGSTHSIHPGGMPRC